MMWFSASVLVVMKLIETSIQMPNEKFSTGPAAAAHLLFAIYLLSLPPKWATLHLGGFLLLSALVFARRETWQCPAMRSYILVTSSWLVPVVLATLWQNLIGLETATTLAQLLKLVLRMLGVGVGLLLLLQRGWLSLHSATFVIMCVLAVNGLAGYVDWIAHIEDVRSVWRSFRMEGLAKNPNPFGTFMALALVMTVGLLRLRSRNPLLWLMLALTVVAIWASGSRGAILAATVGLLVLLIPRNRAMSIAIIGCLLVTVLTAAIYVAPGITYSVSDQLRLDAARFSIAKILEAPVSGWGKEAFSTFPGRPDVNAPHNMILDLAVSSGLVAVMGWLLAMGWLMLSLLRAGSWGARVMLSVLAATIVAGLLEYSMLNSTHFQGIWMLVTVFACWLLAAQRDDDENIADGRDHSAQLG